MEFNSRKMAHDFVEYIENRRKLQRLKALTDDRIVIDEDKWQKYYALVAYVRQLAQKCKGTFDESQVIKKPERGIDVVGVAARFSGEITFGLCDAPMEDFRGAVNVSDGFEIFGTGLDDGSFIITFCLKDMCIYPDTK